MLTWLLFIHGCCVLARGKSPVKVEDVVLANGKVLSFEVRFGADVASSRIPGAAMVSGESNMKKCITPLKLI